MRLPEELLAVIQRETEGVNPGELACASQQLTARYKAADFSAPPVVIQDDAERAAYLAVRLPATYAANWRVLTEIRRLAPQVELRSMLDLGAGPGTTLFAAAELFPELEQATLLEYAEPWLALGQRITRQSPGLRRAQWIRHDLRAALDQGPHDLVIISYTLGELAPSAAETLLRRAWSCAKQFLVVIEPGTPRGFSVVHAARAAMISRQAHAYILAPCPHNLACPMFGTRDWCHFAQRVERTSQHRQLKQGVLGYEDEKFSYIVAGRQALPPARARIVRHPQRHGGHVQLTLCARHSIETRTVTRSQAQQYKLARRAEWGDAWSE
jgi:ribosomal protein RSM22 (predicted rRNA methylase)